MTILTYDDCEAKIIELRQQLTAAQADAKHAWEKAGEACTAHAASIKQVTLLRGAIEKIPSVVHWEDARKIVREALAATEPTAGASS